MHIKHFNYLQMLFKFNSPNFIVNHDIISFTCVGRGKAYDDPCDAREDKVSLSCLSPEPHTWSLPWLGERHLAQVGHRDLSPQQRNYQINSEHMHLSLRKRFNRD